MNSIKNSSACDLVLLSVAMMNPSTESDLGREGFVSSYSLQSIVERSREEPGSRD